MTANELAAIAMEPSGAISMVAATDGAVHRDFLYGNRHTDLNAVFRFRIENRFSSGGAQPRIADTTEPGTREADDGAGQHRSHTGTHDTENRNQKSIENDIEHAHNGI